MEAGGRQQRATGSSGATASLSTTTPLLQSTLSSSAPIFSRQRISHSPPHPVTHLVTSNLQVCLVLANKTVQRINQAAKNAHTGEHQVETIDFARLAPGSTKVHSAHLDPLGSHLLLSLQGQDGQPDLIYLNRRSNKPRQAPKAKGTLVTAVSWHAKNTSESVTGPVLIGTSKGVILEAELDSGEDRMFSHSLERYWRQAADLGKGAHLPITGLAHFGVEGTRRYFVLATTSSRMYQFLGQVSSHEDRPLLLSVINADPSKQAKFLELPGSLKSPTSLFLCYQTKERGKPGARHPLFPSSFGWLTQPGIYHGRVDPNAFADDTVTVDCQLMQFPQREKKDKEQSTPAPKTVLLTEFHAVLVYEDCVQGVCLLNQQVVFTYDFDPAEGSVKGMSRDPVSGSFFVYTDYVVHK